MKIKNIFKVGVTLFAMSLLVLTSCSSDDDNEIEDPVETLPPIELTCSGGQLIEVSTGDPVNDENGNILLYNEPNAPVDYVIDCNYEIPKELTIESGVVIEFTENGGLETREAESILKASGSDDDPIVFRGTKNEKGHWKGIRIGSDNNNNEISYAQIYDAGKEGADAVYVGNNAHLTFTNNEVFHNSNYGLAVFTATPFAGVDSGEYAVVIEENKIHGNKAPIAVHLQNVGNLMPNNDFSGNDRDEIYVETGNSSGYRLMQDVTWHAFEQPYLFYGGDVRTHAKLTIKPGATLKFDLDRELLISGESGPRPAGKIYAVGTEDKPITFTSIEDHAKYWKALKVTSDHPSNEIAHAIIENTGNEDTGNRWTQGNVVLHKNSHHLYIYDVTFKNINPKFCAVRGPAQIENITLEGYDESEACEYNPDHNKGNNDYDLP